MVACGVKLWVTESRTYLCVLLLLCRLFMRSARQGNGHDAIILLVVEGDDGIRENLAPSCHDMTRARSASLSWSNSRWEFDPMVFEVLNPAKLKFSFCVTKVLHAANVVSRSQSLGLLIQSNTPPSSSVLSSSNFCFPGGRDLLLALLVLSLSNMATLWTKSCFLRLSHTSSTSRWSRSSCLWMRLEHAKWSLLTRYLATARSPPVRMFLGHTRLWKR